MTVEGLAYLAHSWLPVAEGAQPPPTGGVPLLAALNEVRVAHWPGWVLPRQLARRLSGSCVSREWQLSVARVLQVRAAGPDGALPAALRAGWPAVAGLKTGYFQRSDSVLDEGCAVITPRTALLHSIIRNPMDDGRRPSRMTVPPSLV